MYIYKGKVIKTFLIFVVIICSISTFAKGVANKPKELPIYSVQTEEKVLALTFDINWAEKDNLYGILDILDKYNVKGTFFIMGGWVNYSDENVKKLKDIYERGHEIGNHSYIHPNFTKVSYERAKEELKKTDDIIDKHIGMKPKLFRFPSGDCDDAKIKQVRELGYECIHWSIDSVDWKNEGMEKEYERVIKKINPGGIILYHNNAKYTPSNLDKLIGECNLKGYEFKTVGEIIYKENYSIDGNGVQYKK